MSSTPNRDLSLNKQFFTFYVHRQEKAIHAKIMNQGLCSIKKTFRVTKSFSVFSYNFLSFVGESVRQCVCFLGGSQVVVEPSQ